MRSIGSQSLYHCAPRCVKAALRTPLFKVRLGRFPGIPRRNVTLMDFRLREGSSLLAAERSYRAESRRDSNVINLSAFMHGM